jgi:hypothetical protein
MTAPFRELENRVRGLLGRPVVHELVSHYVEENPEAANDPHLVMRALIAPLCRGPKDEKRDGWSEQDSWTCFELFLQKGAYMTGGVHLSPAECELVVRIVSGERKLPRRRRSDNRAVVRNYRIVDYLELREADGWDTEAAVAKAQEVYGVGRQTVYTMKKKLRKVAQFEPIARNMTAEARRYLIGYYEQEAEKWRRPKRPRRSSPI